MEAASCFNSLPCGILLVRPDYHGAYANDYFLELSSMKDKEIHDIDLSQKLEFYCGIEEKALDLKDCLKDRKQLTLHRQISFKAGSAEAKPVFMSAKWLPKESFGEELACLSFFDISRISECKFDPVIYAPGQATFFHNLVGHDPKMQEIYKLISLAADSMANVIIQGESGTGKELIASAIHFQSDRREGPFITVNCSALSETLLESELFGHIKGSFTGAYKDKIGRFEAADGGTIFLDEIGDISPATQVKLLRVLQERTIQRVGDNKDINIDIRLICATNRDLRAMVQENTFREDLFFRLNVFPVYTVPLRDRKNDIQLLTDSMIKKFNRKTNRHISGISKDAMQLLMEYCWPGNVRELENAVEHAFVLVKGGEIGPFDLPQEVRHANLRDAICYSPPPATSLSPFTSLNDSPAPRRKRLNITKKQLSDVLKENNGSRADTARQLGISTVALWKRMKKWNLF